MLSQPENHPPFQSSKDDIVDMLMKPVIRVLSPDKHVMEMFAGDVKSMEITYTPIVVSPTD